MRISKGIGGEGRAARRDQKTHRNACVGTREGASSLTPVVQSSRAFIEDQENPQCLQLFLGSARAAF